MEGVSLPQPGPASAFTAWTPQPVAIVLVIAMVVAYARGVRRLRARGGSWPRRRVVRFAIGVVVLAWASCGFGQVYGSSLYWVWTSQALVLWLLVPILILSGQPIQLAQSLGAPRLDRALRSRTARVVSNPLVGPALVPVLSAVLFFGPLAGWAVAASPVGWVLQLVLLAVGALMVLPLIGLEERASSLAVGLSLAIGCFELVIDALPGIVLRLRTHLATSWFDHRALYSWSPGPLHDQRAAAAILWCVAEIIDLPFLYLVFRRWQRADARDAAQVDAVLEAERAAQGADEVRGDQPWWLTDPAMQERMRRGG
jgi:putative membrane protein